MIETIEFQGETYPAFQASGNAMRFCLPYALEVCKGRGVDVGCGKPEWTFPGAVGIDSNRLNEGLDAFHFPGKDYDYVFSSHCLEHIPKWVDALDYWTSRLRVGGVLFLYLPHIAQRYWLPWHNRKHVNIFTPEIIADYMKDNGYKNIFKSGMDLNHSFMVFGEKI